MKIHKEIVWNKGENPKNDGEYLFMQLWSDGSVTYAAKLDYTVQYGWNTHSDDCTHSFGQDPNNGNYVWAELPFKAKSPCRSMD